jgi:hypothetical protein
LPNLTAEDLKDVGIGIVGHRRMLLDAIGALPAGQTQNHRRHHPRRYRHPRLLPLRRPTLPASAGMSR